MVVIFPGFDSGIIQASSFRTYHTPLNKQVLYFLTCVLLYIIFSLFG